MEQQLQEIREMLLAMRAQMANDSTGAAGEDTTRQFDELEQFIRENVVDRLDDIEQRIRNIENTTRLGVS